MAALKPVHRSPARASLRAQRGDIMLVTMVFLLVCLLGLIGSMRDTIVTTTQAGNNLARQKDVQVTDVALRMVANQINSNAGGLELSLNATVIAQTWWRDVAAGTLPPDAAYWKACLGNASTASRCASMALTVGGVALPYNALVVVQPTGRSDRTVSACALGDNYMAVFYDIFVHVQESSGATGVNTETVYKVCVLKPTST